MASTREIGRLAEKQAAAYLAEQGFAILDLNWQAGQKEIDIIAQKDGVLHIVEVRSLASTSIMQPYESISFKKQQNLIWAANAYIEEHELDMEVQFDIISIVRRATFMRLEYIPNAFSPQL